MRMVKKAKSSIKVFLVDDHEILRGGLRRSLELQDDVEVVGDCADAEEALSQVERLSPDIVLMDTQMPGTDGLEATRRLKEKQPACKVIMLTLYREFVAESIEAGADGYLLKDAKCAEVTETIRQVYRSKQSLDQRVGLVEGVCLIIPPPADAGQILGFIGQVEGALDASVRQTIGSRESGTAITIRLKPVPPSILLQKLRSIPDVEKVDVEKVEKWGDDKSATGGGFLKKLKVQPRSNIGPRKRIMVTLK